MTTAPVEAAVTTAAAAVAAVVAVAAVLAAMVAGVTTAAQEASVSIVDWIGDRSWSEEQIEAEGIEVSSSDMAVCRSKVDSL